MTNVLGVGHSSRVQNEVFNKEDMRFLDMTRGIVQVSAIPKQKSYECNEYC